MSDHRLDEQTRAVLVMLLQHAHDLKSSGIVYKSLKVRVMDQARVEMIRDVAMGDIVETLFDTAFDLGRAFESWHRSLPVAEDVA